jgi:hypothetical protein
MASLDEDKRVQDQQLRLALKDIIHGSSELTVKPPRVSSLFDEKRSSFVCYAKHFNFFDQVDLDKKYQTAYDKARSKELPTKEQILKDLAESGDWAEEDEKKYNEKEAFLEGLNNSKSKLVIPSQVANIQGVIDSTQEEINEMAQTRRNLIGQTCESYAIGVLNSYTITSSLFQSRNLEQRLFLEEDIDYLDNNDLGVLIQSYNEGVSMLSLSNIKKLSISGFFTSYFSLIEETPHVFFHKRAVYDLSFYQLNLLSYAKVLRAIIRNSNPPKNIMGNPDKLIEWSEKGEKARKLIEKSRDEDNFSVVGASKEDYEKMGASRKGVSIFDAAKKKGEDKKSASGEMGIMDFL